jgi:hypothetical protein
VAARSMIWVCGRWFIGNAGSNCELESRLGHGCLSLVSVLCFTVEVFASH